MDACAEAHQSMLVGEGCISMEKDTRVTQDGTPLVQDMAPPVSNGRRGFARIGSRVKHQEHAPAQLYVARA